MHLLSFYATPYASRHRHEQQQKRAKFMRILWFVGGIVLGGVVALLLSNAFFENEDSSMQPKLTATNTMDAGLDPIQRYLPTEEGSVRPSAPLLTTPPPATQRPAGEVEIVVAPGDTFISMLTNQGISLIKAHHLSKEIVKHYDLRRLRPGDTMTLMLGSDNEREISEDASADDPPPMLLKKLVMPVSKLETLIIEPTANDEYRIQKIKKKLVSDKSRASAVIDGSLYVSAQKQGVPAQVIMKLIKNYSYDVDFQRDVKSGDRLDIVYEVQRTEDGELIGSEPVDIVYANLNIGKRSLTQYRYTDAEGNTQYYNEKGQNIVKKLLKTPVDGARMSSGFGMRKHPILGYSRMHTGIDFAVPRGTPIYAAGDGVVTYAGYNGGYGNYVRVKHNATYSTAYAHANRIARFIKKGSKVRQGQVIAYVGTTGRSTGPHLHYEILRNGRQINPANVKFAGGNALEGKQLIAFKHYIDGLQQKLASGAIGKKSINETAIPIREIADTSDSKPL